MVPRITCQTVHVPTTRSHGVEQGALIFADARLMAVVTYLDGSVDESLRGRWFVETGYGPCSIPPGDEGLFDSLDAAQEWVLRQVSAPT